MKRQQVLPIEDLQEGRISRREFFRRATLLGFSAAAAAAALEACAPAPTPTPTTEAPAAAATPTRAAVLTPTTEPGVPQEMTIGDKARIITYDPAMQTATADKRYVDAIYDYLVVFDDEMNIVPCLAESWDVSSDAMEWTFHLRRDVAFHDGTPLNADAVKFSLERVLDPALASPRTWPIDMMDHVEVLDEHTAKAVLKYPFTPFLSHLANYGQGAIVSPTAVEQYGAEFSAHATGTGPFKLVEEVAGEYFVLEANEDHWKGRPKLDKATAKVVVEAVTRMVELEAGNLDMLPDVPDADVQRLRDNPDVGVYDIPPMNVRYLGFNHLSQFFQDKRVKQALNYAVNKEAIAERLMLGQGLVAKGCLPPMIWGAKPDLPGFPYDPSRAAALLSEVGWTDEDGDGVLEAHGVDGIADGTKFVTTMFAWEDYRYLPLAEAVAADLEVVGVQSNIEVFDWGTFSQNTHRTTGLHEEFDTYILGWNDKADPDDTLYALFHSQSSENACFYDVEEFDRLIMEARAETDTDKRLALYYRAQDVMQDDPPWIWLVHAKIAFAARNRIKGYVPHAVYHYNWPDMYVGA